MNEIEKLLPKKNVKNFKKEIKKWLKPIKKGIKIEIADSYECVISKPKIYVDILRDLKPNNQVDISHRKVYERSDFQFMSALDYYTFAFLHELGHIMTVKPKNVIEEKELHDEDFERRIASHIQEKGEKPDYETAIEYYMNTSFERKANEWAYDFWKNNRNYCDKLEIILNKYSLEST